ncbi:hypothetical protein [Phycisphaera mikurensis]|uniref:hypothetical protein n=1 Tax=Phycisphaera mikurensis TaxID=547188 RepID=UPI0012B5431D|nr:hypothetical protein [Phycisphaera mikurensis]MBB6441722.1 hypothetical protein [Phycisphaera mikurensis]
MSPPPPAPPAFRLSTAQKVGVSAVLMLAVASLAAVVAAVYFDVTGPSPDGAPILVPAGLIAAWSAIGVVFGVGLLSLVPPLLLAAGSAGPQAAPLGFMAGLMTRLFGTLIGALVGTLGLGLAPRPFLLTLAVVYVMLLPAELIGLPRVNRGGD